jgi:UDP-N-acetylmuramoyl-tripeptide--D-alanyl-D-alanine ligase
VMDIVDDHLMFDLIDDAYNANPASVAAALEVLAASHPTDAIGRVAVGRRIAVLGDMLELGAGEIAMHRDVAKLEALKNVDVVHCVGPLMQRLYEALPTSQQGEWHATASEMVARARTLVDAGDVILIKGSLGIKVSLVVDAIRKLGHPHMKNTTRDE